jgi:hypothetical protein
MKKFCHFPVTDFENQKLKMEKKSLIIQKMKTTKFEYLKGSNKLLEKIRSQRKQAYDSNTITNVTSETCFYQETFLSVNELQNSKDENEIQIMQNLLRKQQNILKELNEENVRLIYENKQLKNRQSN